MTCCARFRGLRASRSAMVCFGSPLAHALGPGQSLTIVVGGATESLSAVPGTNDLTLKRRMGFIKLAVTEGADLVPVFSVRRSTPPRI